MKNKKISDEDLANKVIDLCLWYQIEDSQRYLEFIDLKIKNYKMQIDFLNDERPFWFQKKKLEEHKTKIEELENNIFECYKDIEKEVEMIQKMQNSMTNNQEK